ncbi:MAG: hypothetical protein HYU28_04400 [Actinobacteria bacterium]|nr:hypothetical protein [Actinomycetota bacterium]
MGALDMVVHDVTRSVSEHVESGVINYKQWLTDPDIAALVDLLPEPEHGTAPEPTWACRFRSQIFPVATDGSIADIAVQIARVAQDEVTEETLQAWPACPRHGHPLTPETDDQDRAVWVCPNERSFVVLIGSL